jgi:general secretion pathway protein N
VRAWLPWLLAGLVAGAALFMPLRWALDRARAGQAMSARAVEGSVWAGQLVDARLGGAALGDLSARLLPLALAQGRVEARLAGAAGAGTLVLAAAGGTGVRGLSARLDAVLAAAGAPVAQAQSAGLTALFRRGRCVRAGGTLAATLGAPVPSRARLAGQARCDGDALLLPLAAPSGEALTLRVRADRSYSAELRLPAVEPGTLAAAGFAPAPGGAVLMVEGRL